MGGNTKMAAFKETIVEQLYLLFGIHWICMDFVETKWRGREMVINVSIAHRMQQSYGTVYHIMATMALVSPLELAQISLLQKSAPDSSKRS